MKILIAEDDLTSQLMIKAIVAKAGYEPVVTGDGLSAYELLTKPDAPKLAALDWSIAKKSVTTSNTGSRLKAT